MIPTRNWPETCARWCGNRSPPAGTDAEVKSFLTDRYGEFVLLTPRFSLANAPLWLAGLLVVAAGLALLATRWRRREETPDLDPDEETRLAALLDDKAP
jgi:cytochrome c-type biogenesis protein CcmH